MSFARAFGSPTSSDLCSSAAGAAIEILEQFSLVGTLETLPGFAEGFRRRFGTRLRIGTESRRPLPSTAEADGSPEVDARIKARVTGLYRPRAGSTLPSP
jgi:hypothetical protein